MLKICKIIDIQANSKKEAAKVAMLILFSESN